MTTEKHSFDTLCGTISQLRGKNGCPWDQKQTPQTLKKYLLEEMEELIEAIANNNEKQICEEAGDTIFLLILLSHIQAEKGNFTISDVLDGINKKMIRRHPHVFENVIINNEVALRKQWEKIKLQEKAEK